jgi:large subunit ribosomal protein L13
MRTTYITKPKEIIRRWFLVDATGQTLGRLATQVVNILRGKNKVVYAPNVDAGDYVIIINASKIHVTGKKLEQKIYRHHSGYPGGMKEIILKNMLIRRPEFALYHAIKGMLPKNNLGHAVIKKLFLYSGDNYKQKAQKPVKLVLSKNK